jgi:hypothetical protein
MKAVDFLSSGNPLPPPDRFEPNDDASQAYPLWGTRRTVTATLDYWDDRVDVYRVKLATEQRLQAYAWARWSDAKIRLSLWPPGTTTVLHGQIHARYRRAAQSARPGRAQHLSYRAPNGGWYFVELKVVRPGGGAYSLYLAKA